MAKSCRLRVALGHASAATRLAAGSVNGQGVDSSGKAGSAAAVSHSVDLPACGQYSRGYR